MEDKDALSAFAALAQETRLGIVRMLVVAGKDGLAAGDIAERAGVSASNVSFHLKELDRAGLIVSERASRSIIYTANYTALGALVQFLMRDCCAGHPDICAPALDAAACCIPSAPTMGVSS